MSKLDETWTSIQEYLQLYKDVDSLPSDERRQKWLKIAMGVRQLQADIDYFLENTPPGDLRRDVCLDLKELMAQKSHSMSELDNAWVNIKESFEAWTAENPTPGKFNPSFAQARSQLLNGLGKLRQDIEYFLKNAPLDDSRRASVLQLKKIVDKTFG